MDSIPGTCQTDEPNFNPGKWRSCNGQCYHCYGVVGSGKQHIDALCRGGGAAVFWKKHQTYINIYIYSYLEVYVYLYTTRHDSDIYINLYIY